MSTLLKLLCQYHIDYELMLLSAYWQWKSANKHTRISAVIVIIKITVFSTKMLFLYLKISANFCKHLPVLPCKTKSK